MQSGGGGDRTSSWHILRPYWLATSVNLTRYVDLTVSSLRRIVCITNFKVGPQAGLGSETVGGTHCAMTKARSGVRAPTFVLCLDTQESTSRRGRDESASFPGHKQLYYIGQSYLITSVVARSLSVNLPCDRLTCT